MAKQVNGPAMRTATQAINGTTRDDRTSHATSEATGADDDDVKHVTGQRPHTLLTVCDEDDDRYGMDAMLGYDCSGTDVHSMIADESGGANCFADGRARIVD